MTLPPSAFLLDQLSCASCYTTQNFVTTVNESASSNNQYITVVIYHKNCHLPSEITTSLAPCLQVAYRLKKIYRNANMNVVALSFWLTLQSHILPLFVS